MSPMDLVRLASHADVLRLQFAVKFAAYGKMAGYGMYVTSTVMLDWTHVLTWVARAMKHGNLRTRLGLPTLH